MTRLLGDLPGYIYGTTRLGDPSIPRQQRVAAARAAFERGLWMHTSRQYGEALEVLGEVFADGRSAEAASTTSLIVKLGGGAEADVRATLRENLDPLGIDSVAIGQLSPVDGLEEQLLSGSSSLAGFTRLKDEGLVGRFVLEIFPWTSAAPLQALRSGHLDGLIDGVITYYNPLQRFASNDLWAELRDRDVSIISMRTVAGAPVHALRDVPGAAWLPYLKDRAADIAPVFERSGIDSWAEFCLRFVRSLPQVVSTIGSTSQSAHLHELISQSADPAPLPNEVLEEIYELQARWSDETDVHAAPWSM